MARKKLFLGMVGLGAALALAPAVFADCNQKITLTATGTVPDASGTAQKVASGTGQRFKVSMDAAVPDGTTYGVVVNNKRFVGTIKITLGAGELQIENNKGNPDPAATDPFCAISSVAVIDGTLHALLLGTF